MIKIFIRNEPAYGTTDLFIFDERENGKRFISNPMELHFKPYEEGTIAEPTLRFPSFMGNGFLSELSNALIEAGYRDKIIDPKSEIKRLENHLEDMRQLVFKRKEGV